MIFLRRQVCPHSRNGQTIGLLSFDHLEIVAKKMQHAQVAEHKDEEEGQQGNHDDHRHSVLPVGFRLNFHRATGAGGTARNVNNGRTRPGLKLPRVLGWSSSSQRQAVTPGRGSGAMAEAFT